MEKPFTAEDYRFTSNRGFVYAIELGWPASGESVICSFAPPTVAVSDVTLLGYGQKLECRHQPDGLPIKVPASPVRKHAYKFRIALSIRRGLETSSLSLPNASKDKSKGEMLGSPLRHALRPRGSGRGDEFVVRLARYGEFYS